jgi:hypothetical protein
MSVCRLDANSLILILQIYGFIENKDKRISLSLFSKQNGEGQELKYAC